ncbi:MAG: DUF883 domain-containing protein [Proteobacteria bacterium]|nr:DUF883 domain-containing protein [Pseudomonadota bacterium]
MTATNSNANTNTFKTVRSDFKTLMHDAQQMLREATASTGERAEELRVKGMALLDSAMHKAQEVQAAAIQSGKEVAETTDTFVRENPWKAVAISAGVGLVIGVLIARR